GASPPDAPFTVGMSVRAGTSLPDRGDPMHRHESDRQSDPNRVPNEHLQHDVSTGTTEVRGPEPGPARALLINGGMPTGQRPAPPGRSSYFRCIRRIPRTRTQTRSIGSRRGCSAPNSRDVVKEHHATKRVHRAG